MLKFFRQIRQQLISQNNFSKYLLYALGEIILVVIGILIAISLNNANQNKIEQAVLNEKLIKLRQEIYQDSLLFIHIKSFNEQINKNIDQALQKLHPTIAYADYLDFIQLFQKNELRFRVFISKANTYNELVNSGDFSKIKAKQLKEKITVLYSFYSHYANVTYADIDNLFAYNQKLYSDGILRAKYLQPNLTEATQKAGFQFFKKELSNPKNRLILENYLIKEQTFRRRIIKRYDTMLELMEGLPLLPKG